jgi:hypothetical protein
MRIVDRCSLFSKVEGPWAWGGPATTGILNNLFFQVNDFKQKIKASKSAEAQMILE